MVAILSQQREVILEAVRAMYTEVALHPERTFHFPTGRPACRLLGYPDELLDALPAGALESFAGVGFPFLAGVIRWGDTVLDIGSGSGSDALIASRLVGPGGRVIGLELTGTMLAKLERNAALAGAGHLRALEGNAESIPLEDGTVDVVTSNGVLNLVPDKARAVREIHRVLRPGGRVQIADIVLGRSASDACRNDPQLWAECVVGATTEADYLRLFRDAGFREVEVLARHDYFAASPSPQTREVAELLGALALVLRARRPEPGEGPDVEPEEEASEPPVQMTFFERGAVSADRLFDAGDRGCGEVTPLVRRELKQLQPGQVLGVRSTVPEAAPELGAWCRMTGHEFLGSEPADGAARLHFIRRKPH